MHVIYLPVTIVVPGPEVRADGVTRLVCAAICRSIDVSIACRIVSNVIAAGPDVPGVPELADAVLGPGRLLVLVAVWVTSFFSTGSDILAWGRCFHLMSDDLLSAMLIANALNC